MKLAKRLDTDADARNDFVAIIPSNRHRTRLHFEENCAILRIDDEVRLDYTPSFALTGSLVTTAYCSATAPTPRLAAVANASPRPRFMGWTRAGSTRNPPGHGPEEWRPALWHATSRCSRKAWLQLGSNGQPTRLDQSMPLPGEPLPILSLPLKARRAAPSSRPCTQVYGYSNPRKSCHFGPFCAT
jgi:hypothetical protein